jgi:lipid II:glycine glycyltransferase (peptidoglycan interpeptide bridge formation enzyme)
LKPIETLWTNFKQKVRNNVRKAENHELTFKVYHGEFTADIMKNFHNIYIDTMDRNSASNKYYFSLAYFEQLVSNNPFKCAIAFVYNKEQPISTELLLISEDSIYSYLGGTNADYFEMRPNDYLKYKVADWGFKQDKKYYILGGGRKNKDGLYDYKKSFFANDQDAIFYTGRKIVNLEMYKKLTELSLKLKIDEFEKNISLNYFPIYRSNKSNA